MRITGRMGSAPPERASCTGANSCPDVFRLDTGDYLVIGKIAGAPEDNLASELERHGAKVGTGEVAVVVPADCMTAAAHDIADGHSEDGEFTITEVLDLLNSMAEQQRIQVEEIERIIENRPADPEETE